MCYNILIVMDFFLCKNERQRLRYVHNTLKIWNVLETLHESKEVYRPLVGL